MNKMNLIKAEMEISKIKKRRREIRYTGREDLDLIQKMFDIRNEAKDELGKVRAQIEVCTNSMLGELKNREHELVGFLRDTK